MTTLAGLLGLGFTLGLKHALDADHLAAVATIVGREHGLKRAGAIGLSWGLGHTAALLAIGLTMLLFGVQLPERLGAALELLVALMLAYLGGRLLWQIVRGDRLHFHWHRHGLRIHRHPHRHPGPDATIAPTVTADAASGHVHGPGLRSFLVGLVHGVAGSAALMLLVLATVTDRLTGLLFIGVFGLGSVGGMFAMSAALSLPFAGAARRSGRLLRVVQAGAAVLSLAVAAGIVREFVAGM